MEGTDRARPGGIHWRGFGVQAGALFGVWLLLSGHYDLFHLCLGVLSVGAVLWINSRLVPFAPADEDRPIRMRIGRALVYVCWLLGQMVLSGMHVARVVLDPRLPIDPWLIRFTSPLPTDTGAVVLGNSITLTPGTLTIEIQARQFLVHSLTTETAARLLTGEMQGRVARLYVDRPGEMVFDIHTTSE